MVPPVAAGVGGSAGSLAAAECAAGGTACRERPLRLPHARNRHPRQGGGEATDAARRHPARRVPRQAHGRIRTACPGLRVDDEQTEGPVTGALLKAAEDAEPLLLGSRGPSGTTGSLVGSASLLRPGPVPGCPAVRAASPGYGRPGPQVRTDTATADGVMHVDVNEVLLPGVGLRYEFTNHEGERVGVVAQRSGEFELVVYPGEDPDEARPVLRLTGEEADTLAEILGAPRIAERFADLTREVPGLGAGQVEVRPGSPFAGRPLGETRARTRTGASIVAVVRGEDVIASPGPAQRLRAGDVLVVIGTREGITGVQHIVQG
ncbi:MULTISPECIES: TrkA C-terminal domain-containing protein [Streptomyces]|nr:TrkA C-terminal domain-containing protein [Streptomyces ruber]